MKTSNLLLLLAFAGVATFSISQVIVAKTKLVPAVELTGERVTRTFDLPALKHLDFEGPIRLILTAGMPSVTLEGDAALVADLADLDDAPDRLTLHVPRAKGTTGERQVTARISSPDLRSVSMGGENVVSATAPLDYRSLRLRLSGGTEVDLAFVAIDSLRVEGSGSVTGKLSGRAGYLFIEGSGRSDVDATDLVSKTAGVQISGSGDIRLHADSLLDVKGSGSVNVRYTGTPHVTSSVSGAGSVESM